MIKVIPTNLVLLRVEIIVPDDNNVKPPGEALLERGRTLDLDNERKRILNRQMDKLVLRRSLRTFRPQSMKARSKKQTKAQDVRLDGHFTPTCVVVYGIRPCSVEELRRSDLDMVWRVGAGNRSRVADDGVEPRRSGYDDARVGWVEDEVASSDENFSWGRDDGRHSVQRQRTEDG